MFAPKLFCLLVLFVGVHSRHVLVSKVNDGRVYFIDTIGEEGSEETEETERFEQPRFLHIDSKKIPRIRRQAQGSVVLNSDGTSGANLKVPFAGNDKHVLSAIGGVDLKNNLHLGAATAGLAYDNVNGHGLTLTKTHIPSFGDQLTAAGKLNLVGNSNHNLDVNAFATRNMPTIPMAPNFNTMGGNLDYMYKNKVGATLGAAHTPLFQKTDYSAAGNLNLFRNHDSSLDFKAGFSKSVSPFIPKSSWEPNYGFSFRKFF